jgi:hypothetical protein
MKDHFEEAFKRFDECMQEFGKGINSIIDDVTAKVPKETRIKIKTGSVVYIGKGVHARLTSDVEAIIVDGDEKKEAENKA